MKTVLRSVLDKIFAGLLGLTIGTGIAAIQYLLHANGPNYFENPPGIGGIGIPFVGGGFAAIACVLFWLIRKRPLSLESLAVAASVALGIGAAVARMPTWYALAIPPIALLVTGLTLDRSSESRPLPKPVRVLLILSLSALIGAGAGYWQMGFASPEFGVFKPDGVDDVAGAFIGLLFAAIAGPAAYILAFDYILSVLDAGWIVTVGMLAGCVAAYEFGPGSFMVTIVVVIAAVLALPKTDESGKSLKFRRLL